jgi:pimeloyl-ACP methyl ester carboxylesterase
MRIEVNGIGLEVQDVGSGAPVLLLHGWPDSGRLWRHQVPALTGAGFRCIVPDLRGFGESDKPDDVAAYALPNLVGDVAGLLDQMGIGRAHVIGHDWGAALAWVTASLLPDRVDRLVAISVGFPAAFAAAGYEQREKSWYMLLFQFRDVAEQWLSMDNWRNFREWSRHPDADEVIATLEKGALTPGLNWYRANVAPETLLTGPPPLPPVQAPTMGVWSSGDVALTEAQMTSSQQFVSGDWRYERVDGVGHWVPVEAPETLNRLLVDFLAAE